MSKPAGAAVGFYRVSRRLFARGRRDPMRACFERGLKRAKLANWGRMGSARAGGAPGVPKATVPVGKRSHL